MISLRHRRVAWLIALIAVLGVGLTAHLSRQRIFQLEGEVRHTLDVRDAVEATLTSILDAETAQRGYLLTGDPAFLEPYEMARDKLDSQFEQLRKVTEEDERQVA